MLDSLHRVLGTTDEDWVISYEPAAKWAQDGLEELSKAIITGKAKNMYANHFMRRRAGELIYLKSLANEVLGLPKESLDKATKGLWRWWRAAGVRWPVDLAVSIRYLMQGYCRLLWGPRRILQLAADDSKGTFKLGKCHKERKRERKLR